MSAIEQVSSFALEIIFFNAMFKVNRNIHIILPTKCFNASKAELRGS